jgi:hypothetical protein
MPAEPFLAEKFEDLPFLPNALPVIRIELFSPFTLSHRLFLLKLSELELS